MDSKGQFFHDLVREFVKWQIKFLDWVVSSKSKGYILEIVFTQKAIDELEFFERFGGRDKIL